ncbi:acyl CoA:acetate/3-ketoacid CoA transferase [Acetobacterium carbinolicum]|jgi:propionate CoA-transferase|uniref:acyl CoA:acetate/3-ketoacid CoA transferase n=1 Tax=Acetobacterium TaxID=33951 RepID=UPI000DBEBD1A|nr:acyl CoA:acetate/3-ketoacid CoA transferase [Acetobacterium sp. KB-1]AWW27267.1 acyl CoA:acetate/3-ketoacid CoA transferase [Acetobacterium sp. KB-1]
MSKQILAREAVGLIKDKSTVVWTTAGLCCFPEEIAVALEKRFLETGQPKNLTIVHSCGCGDGKDKGMNHLAYEGLTERLISGHTGQAPRMGELITENKIETYLLPQGVMAHLWREIAGKKPGVITKVGLRTYVDPRLQGGKITKCTKEDLVELMEIDNQEWLRYKTFPIDVAIIRATTADQKGNLSMEKEGLLLEALPMAQAAKNSGGIVIAQVEYLAKAGSLHPLDVKVPGALVDYIVVASPENHMQTTGTQFNPAFVGDLKMPMDSIKPMLFNERKIIARRAAMELDANGIINLGIGMPDGVARVASEEGIADDLVMTTELGTYGGIPGAGDDFGVAYNAEAIIEHEAQFDFYDGGGLSATFLGLAQTDKKGNLNVSKFGKKVVGSGGFINISQNSKKVIFCGTFTAGGGKYEIKDGKIRILEEGRVKKFVNQVDHITFSGEYATEIKQPVLYITERAVFTLEDGEMTLIEIAPGISIERDILPAMEFAPRISPDLKEMDSSIFYEQWNQLKNSMISSSQTART